MKIQAKRRTDGGIIKKETKVKQCSKMGVK